MVPGKGPEVRLQVLITAAIVLSMLLLSLAQVGKSYLDQRTLLLQGAVESVKQRAQAIDTHIGQLIDPLQGALRVLSHDPVATASSATARMQRLPVLVDILRSAPEVSAIHIGYADDSLLWLQALKNDDVRRLLRPPDAATIAVQSIDGNGTSGRTYFYDGTLRLLETRNAVDPALGPGNRSLYRRALRTLPVVSDPYLMPHFNTLGVTLVMQSADGSAVVAIDTLIDHPEAPLIGFGRQPNAKLAIVDYAHQVVAYSDRSRMLIPTDTVPHLASIAELKEPNIAKLAAVDQPPRALQQLDMTEERVFGFWVPLSSFPGASLRLLWTLPAADLLAAAREQILIQIYWTLAAILVLVLLGAMAGRLVAQPLKQLAQDMRAVASFDFTRPVRVNSPIKEVNALGRVMSSMSRTIHHFQRMSLTLSREPDLDRMLSGVVRHLKDSLAATSAVLYLYEDDRTALRLVAMSGLAEAPKTLRNRFTDVEHMKQLVLEVFDGSRADDILMTALKGRNNQPLGILALDLPHEADVSMKLLQRAVDELSGSAATAIETRQLVGRQRRLLDAMIRLLADAIDAKSPYTSGHCERVPELAQMLIEAAEASNKEPFGEFAMSEAERDEFWVAAWLHDCGKITSPEYVVDKATKLETIYNRIHEIRTRFEVLWRDAEIRYLKGRLEGRPESDLRRWLEERRKQLQSDFAFVASANIGAEFGAEEDRERLRRIGSQTWQRYFDRRLGLSRDEYERLPAGVHIEELPITERLLDDRPDHLVEWGDRRPPVERNNPANRWGFDMELPEHSFNLGELYNLSVNAGTLTREERFHINDHIVQTICMLNNLPLPPELKRVPDIAGNHHERVDGRGYPRRLPAGELSIPERVMAVADIFEALTAADRPYKKAKTLSESLTIMARMVKNQHIDLDLFELFLDSRIYLTYAKRFLQPAQIDEARIDRRQLMLLARRGEDDYRHSSGERAPVPN